MKTEATARKLETMDVDPFLPQDVAAAKVYEQALVTAEASMERGENPRLDASACVAAAGHVEGLLGKDAKLAKALTERKFGSAHVHALVKGAEAFQAAVHATPPDRREWEQLTPQQKARVPVIAAELSAFKSAVTVKAKRMGGVEQVRVLGRGMSISRESPKSVHDGLVKFLTGAPEREELLNATGVTPADLAHLAAMRDELAQYPAFKLGRSQDRSELSGKLDLYGLLVEVLFDDLRVAASLAFRDNPAAFAKVVESIPRAAERRGGKGGKGGGGAAGGGGAT